MKRIKEVLLLCLVSASLSVLAQQSALLRLNYGLGDNYTIRIEQKQNSETGGLSMNMGMDMVVTEASDTLFKTESKITSIAMSMMQGAMTMSYDSSKKDEELDQRGKILQSQFDPMMRAIIFNSYDSYGNTTETTIEPAIPGVDQFTSGSGMMNYPEGIVSQGTSWQSDDEKQGMKISITYMVREIREGIAYLDISGTVSGSGTGSIIGSSEIEIQSGAARNTDIKFEVSAQGMDMNIYSKITMTKV